ncbi:DUF6194 family protein [Streptomyces sp. NPDC046203]|uniref:DUF6194 family protein n=1 Tax=Streptomyces sp. NPDC046203 TaxID=3154602 RepID=UPI003403125F
MTLDEILDFVGALDGVLPLSPAPGDGTPEISWGDTFFYYAPDCTVPTTAQPFATVVTKDYPGDASSRLDRPGFFRVNMAAGKAAFTEWTADAPGDPSAVDAVITHPVYGGMGWLAVVNPGARTETVTRDLLRTAHHLARARHERRAG